MSQNQLQNCKLMIQVEFILIEQICKFTNNKQLTTYMGRTRISC